MYLFYTHIITWGQGVEKTPSICQKHIAKNLQAIFTPKSLSPIMGMRSLDRLLKQLRDSKWHGIEEIRTAIALPPDQLDQIVSFLQYMEFIYKENEKLKITQRGMKYLEF